MTRDLESVELLAKLLAIVTPNFWMKIVYLFLGENLPFPRNLSLVFFDLIKSADLPQPSPEPSKMQ